MERLQKVIANAGIASRREAEKLISDGRVKVNGEVMREMGYKVTNKDVVSINGEVLEKEEKEYYLLYKPKNVITSNKDEKNRTTVVDLIPTKKRIYPIGRLDFDTTGVLLLTNDGDFANIMMHPKYEVDKVYIAKIGGILNPKAQMMLKKGFMVDGYKTKPAGVNIKKVDKAKNTSVVELTIHEGKNHQVKNMFKALGHPVIKLKREKVAFLTVEGMKPGESRKLTSKEVHVLYNISKNEGSIHYKK